MIRYSRSDYVVYDRRSGEIIKKCQSLADAENWVEMMGYESRHIIVTAQQYMLKFHNNTSRF